MKQDDWTDEEAAIVKGMAERGDEQHNIAAWFGINHGRISEIVNGKEVLGEKFKDILPAEASVLPPPGPYISGQSTMRAQKMLSDLKASILSSIENMEKELIQSDEVIAENYQRVEKRKHNRKKNKEKAAKKNEKIKRQERVAEVLKDFKPLNL